MKPLLRIQSIPIKIEAQTKRASLQRSNDLQNPSMEITRSRGRVNIQTTQPKINIDTTEARANLGLKSTPRVVRETAQTGMAAANESTRNYTEENAQLRSSNGKGDPIIDIAAARFNRPINDGQSYQPMQQPDVEVEAGSVSFDYQMDSLTFDWNVHTKPQLEYVPASIEYSIKQYPQLVIEYIGEPIYVPASANPNYQKQA